MTRSSLTRSRRPAAVRTAAATMGLLAAGTAFAPGALADDGAPTTAGSDPATDTAPLPDATVTPEVVTPEPAPAADGEVAAGVEEELPGAWFGWGKLGIGVDAVPGTVPAGVQLDLTGAQVEVAFDQMVGDPSDVTVTCTFDHDDCVFPHDQDELDGDDLVFLPPSSVFTVTLVTAPVSRQLLAGASLQGHTTDDPNEDETARVGLTAEGGYRTLGVAVSGSGPLAGAAFRLGDGSTATTDGSGRATFGGRYLPGTYTVTQTAAPGGASFDATPRPLTVGVAASVTERDTPVLLPVALTAPAPAPTATVATESVRAGAQQTVTLVGFQPFEMVHGILHSTPVDLGTVQADATGAATFTFAVPAGFELGAHEITMTGLTSGAVASDTFTVTGGAAGASLAYTGADVAPLLVVGGTLVAGGAAALLVGRRRRLS